MQEEKKYLKNVCESIQNQLSEATLEIAKLENETKRIKEQIHINFYDIDNEEMKRYETDFINTERTLEVLRKDKKRLEAQQNKPYFARIDFKTADTEDKIYIGLGYLKEKDQPLVYDWRAPISSMYYDFDLGKASYACEEGQVEGEITLKRQFNIENQKLNFYIDTEETINDEILQQVLSQNSSAKMKEIVSSIQKEQNKLIRSEESGNLLVQGVAGSGKTSVALHRAGYLLYKDKNISSRDIFILSPSSLFSGYVGQVLPELGEDNVVFATFLNIAKTELGRKIQTREMLVDELCEKREQRLMAVAYKSSFSFLEDLVSFLKESFSKTFRPKDLNFYAKDNEAPLFSFSKEEMENLYYKTYKDLDIAKRISYMSEYLIERFNLRKKEFMPIKERFSRMLYNFFPTTDLQKILNLFLSTKEIDGNESSVCLYEDIAGLLIIKDYLFGLNVDMPSKYIIIDEAQDFTPAHFYLFNKFWDCPKLLLGDINQCIEKKLTPEYLDMLAVFMDAKQINLNKTYRSTKEISEFGQKIIGLKNVVNMNRSGQKPDIIKTNNQVEEIAELVSENMSNYKHIAIICKTSKEADEMTEDLKKYLTVHRLCSSDSDFDYKVLVTTPATSKGIEFDYVIIPNADDSNYSDGLDKNLLYVSCTRALHKLTLLYSKKLTSLIKE